MRWLVQWPIAVALTGLLAWVSPPRIATAQPSGQARRLVSGFEIIIHTGRDTAYDDLWAVLPDRIRQIRRLLGDQVLQGGEIHVMSDLNRYFLARDEPDRAPRWAQALAIPSRRTILLRMPDPDPVRTLTHELSHLAVYEAVGGHHLPRWFLEGFAIYQAEEWGANRFFSIAMAALFGNTLSFESLDTAFPPHSQSAGLAYAQSFHFVRRLIDDYGEAPIRAWLRGVAAGTPWRAAFEAAYGVDFASEAEAWKESVAVWYAWIPAIVSMTTLWTGLAFLALWARRRVKHRRALRLAQMGAEERGLYPPDPDDDLFT